MKYDLLKQLHELMHTFSKGQRLIATYILQHYEKAAFMTAAKLGETVGVSESTVVRFAIEVGFDGYPQLQKNLQELIRNRLTSIQRMEIMNEQLSSSEILSRVLTLDAEKIKRTLEEINRDSFANAVETIINANNHYIIGIRSSNSLCGFLAFYFNHIFSNVRTIGTTSSSEVFEQLIRIEKGDVLIAITFPRYSQRTLKAAQFAKKRGATVIAITDSESAPLAQIADITLVAKSDMASFVDSLVAPMSLINALIVAIGNQKKSEIAKSYEALEKIWDEYNVYERNNEEHVNV